MSSKQEKEVFFCVAINRNTKDAFKKGVKKYGGGNRMKSIVEGLLKEWLKNKKEEAKSEKTV